jgi:ribose 5-phosphate isomerase B
MRDLITEREIEQARRAGGVLRVAGEFVLTPGAQDRMLKLGVRIEEARPGTDLSRSRGRAAVAVAADHGGYELKEDLKRHLETLGYVVLDFGTTSREACDYPDFAHAAAVAVAEGTADRGIVVDGAGIGSSMVANKVPGVRAAKCDSMFDVENSRRHNDANVLSLSARLERSLAREMSRVWLETPFEGGRHARRVDKIRDIERRYLTREVHHGRE